ncbi:polysaccharide pyruvyl transferase family protein [Sodalis sp. RH20]|uniref:polysaccharide pyruvyl transferase family protein n=1 Tax=unclassified Sodalis (in: enterobacteria) TaxID=2636512 RepID=UPI0039B4641A
MKMFKFNFHSKNDIKNKVFWWEPVDGQQNAGDHLAKIIVQQMLILKDKEMIDKVSAKNKLLSIGSVMHFAQDNDCIWGTGINGKIPAKNIKFSTLDVRSVRGPLTRNFLMSRGIPVPEVYGDPGLLLPLFFNRELLVDETKRKDLLIIPHMNEDFSRYSAYKDNLCSPRQGAISFTTEIVNSGFVISSSLHGIIIAEAYGIPAIFLNSNSGESIFKYNDYYNGTYREAYPIAKTIEEAFKLNPLPTFDFSNIQKGLINSFPYDLW